MKKTVTVLVTAALLLTALAACSRSDRNDTAREITVSEGWNFAGGFYPIETFVVNTNYGPAFYMYNFYETLVNYKDGEFVPGLAESWDISNDGLAYTFHLRKNVKFSDGTVFDAEAVKRNLEVIPQNLGKANGSYGTVTTLFKRIVVVDPHTIEVHLTAPYYGVLKDFTLIHPMAMVSPHAFHEDGTVKDDLKTSTLGTGPYMYKGDTDGTTYTFVKNPHYWGKEPETDRFHVKVIPDNDARLLALRNGEVDLIVGTRQITYDGLNEMKASGYGTLVSEGINYTRYFGFNVSKAPFNDRNVRLAASYALDKQRISESILSGIEAKADSIFDPALPYCDVKLEPYGHDKQKAIALLEEAGWVDSNGDGVREKDGVSLKGEILYSKDNTMVDDLMLAVAAQWKEIGMDIRLNGMEMTAYYSELQNNNFTIAYGMTYGSAWDPYTSITNMKPGQKSNYAAAQALELVEDGSKIINALNVTVDRNEIRKTYDFILREIHDNAILLPLSYTKEVAVYNKSKIKDYTFNGQLAYIDIAAISLK
ncbi:nickel ABC transporter substrate-binding protein [Paenibacillus ehimensis]|uniref:nickel ABC transporter substrate-binding protein n=1 Tax=Paenibacillus ehimensis TaxID=79264 RepID=UPI000FD92EC7|nr:nickel ABC transporter substrate-binding protein [Paenibacillus ehimensis]